MENIKNKKSIIILNDLRAVPILSVLKLKSNITNIDFVAHESIFLNKEFADYTNVYWKLIIKFFLKSFFKLKIIKTKEKVLNEEDKMGYYSSFYSITADSNASEVKYPKIAKEINNLALGSLDIINYLKSIEFDNLFIFNGRTASSYTITKYCVKNTKNLFFYEYAGHLNGFRLFPVPPHADGKLGELLLNYYKCGVYSLYSIFIAAEKLKNEKLNSIYKINNNEEINDKFDISIFLGSDFEYTSIDPEICDVYWSGNLNFCKTVILKYGIEKKYAIRCHPNSENDPNWSKLYKELIEGVKAISANVKIIPPNSKIDSHILINNSSLVVTDLSTISLDSILLKKETVIFGNTSVRYIQNNKWFNSQTEINLSDRIMLPYALTHNFFVFRFSKIEKMFGYFIFLIHRSFEKIYYKFK